MIHGQDWILIWARGGGRGGVGVLYSNSRLSDSLFSLFTYTSSSTCCCSILLTKMIRWRMEFSMFNTRVNIPDSSLVKFMGLLDTDWITFTNWRHVCSLCGLCPHLLTRAGLLRSMKVHQVFHTYNEYTYLCHHNEYKRL